MNYFTSDTHFFHKKIREFCPNRPGTDTSTMNEEMVRIWNETVGPDDTVFHLGDFSFGKSEETKAILNRLNGTKVLVMGNHDRRSEYWYRRNGFYVVYRCSTLIKWPAGYKVMLSHYPFKLGWWERIWYGITDPGYTRFQDRKIPDDGICYLLHGHCHGKYYRQKGRAIDVGWDSWGRPVSQRELEKLMGVIQ
jgi:calcineurin-like phosphoesterase family protein